MTHVEARETAVQLLLKAGFVFVSAALTTDSCHYTHPARTPFLLRVGTHKSKKAPMGLSNIVARLTFTAKDTLHLSERLVRQRVKWAIGEYFLGEPKPTRYLGKRGTWEASNGQQAQATG